MPPPLFRFRRFGLRVLFMLLALLGTVLGATYQLVTRANDTNARAHIEANLELGARIYDRSVLKQIEHLTGSAGVMTQDYAIKQVLLSDRPDTRTLSSNLKSFTGRVGAPVIALFNTQGELLANSAAGMDNENRGPFAHLIHTATDQDMPEGNGFAYLDRALHVLVVVPLYAPFPEVAAWFGLAFPINTKFAREIKDVTQLEVTFVSTEDSTGPRVLTTTLPGREAAAVALAAAANMKHPVRIRTLDLAGESYVTLFKPQEMLGDAAVTVVLQRPLSTELAAARELENFVLLISLAALAVAALMALWIARGVSQPVRALAAHTRHVAAGDYTHHIDLRREDELGQLAASFNHMTSGLAERDRVRDLLGKVVSPEIAAQLLGSDLRLGGEEREVTILFCDIRNFTALSERRAPTEVLTLLNRYLDRMSGVVEKHGGVIDKYIGDAIMALFGAPVAAADAADRALAAALAMGAALDELNQQLATDGIPALEIGIGINTARVVAGNMGSKTRLNYTVIGDGVNLASRLESLTKETDYRARIIVSEATVLAAKNPPPLRPLGEVTVKGKATAVQIFGLE